jgi:hypothetical protein
MAFSIDVVFVFALARRDRARVRILFFENAESEVLFVVSH